MNNLDKQYQELLQHIIDNGIEKKDRTGTGTKSIFGYQIRHKMSEGFPLLTTKKMAWKQIVTELMWFLLGKTNIKYLLENDCNIWNGDAYASYVKIVTQNPTTETKEYEGSCDYELVTDTVLEDVGSKYAYYPKPFTMEKFIEKIMKDEEFASKWGELGPIYGKQWRNWKTFKTVHVDIINQDEGIYKIKNVEFEHKDQILNLFKELKDNPDSRRLMVSAWNVGELDQMVLPPCHYGFQVYTRELSESERFDWYGNKIGSHMHHDHIEQEMNENNVPTRAISLMWNQRSVDTFLGLPFNIASYGLLLEIIAMSMNMVPEELIGNLGDTHLYLNHIQQAKKQISREPYSLPKLIYDTPLEIKEIYLNPNNFILENYESHPPIKAPLSN